MGAKKQAAASPKPAAARPRRAAASPAAAAPGPSPAGARKPAKKAAAADAGPVLDRETIAALTREIVGAGGVNAGSGNFDDAAIETLREAAEAHVTSIFEHARAAAAAAGREELTLEDVRGVTAAMAKALEKMDKGAAK